MATSERLQKILAKAGIASRRRAEDLIQEGQVTVNGRVAKLGDKAELGKDAIKVAGKLLQRAEDPVYLAFYKPKGVISMLVDTENRPTLADYLTKVHERVFPIGRLDFNSEGLIFLTNDGDFAEKLQRRDDIPRVYQIKVRGHLDAEMVKRLQKGARIGNRMVRPHSVRVKQELNSKTFVELVILGSGAHDIKSMVEFKGFLVERITRTAIGHLTLKGLIPGHYRLLKKSQADALLEHPELGLQKLEAGERADRERGGQRNIHAKKVVVAPISGDIQEQPSVKRDTPKPRPRTPMTRTAPLRTESRTPRGAGRPSMPRAGSSRTDSRGKSAPRGPIKPRRNSSY